jgi:hypothetical protein
MPPSSRQLLCLHENQYINNVYAEILSDEQVFQSCTNNQYSRDRILHLQCRHDEWPSVTDMPVCQIDTSTTFCMMCQEGEVKLCGYLFDLHLSPCCLTWCPCHTILFPFFRVLSVSYGSS